MLMLLRSGSAMFVGIVCREKYFIITDGSQLCINGLGRMDLVHKPQKNVTTDEEITYSTEALLKALYDIDSGDLSALVAGLA